MPAPVDPWPNFINGTTVADGDQVDQRFKALYDALDPSQAGIDSSMIRDGAIATVDLADGAVTSVKVADGAVTSAKIADATIVLADLAAAVVNNFVKTVGGTDHAVNFGQKTLTYSGLSGILRGVVAHGLGGAPSCVLGGLAFGGGGYYGLQWLGCSFLDGTNIQIDVEGVNGVVPGPGDSCSVFWLAAR